MRLLALSVCLTALVNPAVAATAYTVPSGNTVTINEFGLCYRVGNPGAGTRWISTASSGEWQSFINAPNGLTMTACTLQTKTYTFSYTGGYNDSNATNAYCVGKGYQAMQTYSHTSHVQQQCHNGPGDTGPICENVTYYDTNVVCYRYV